MSNSSVANIGCNGILDYGGLPGFSISTCNILGVCIPNIPPASQTQHPAAAAKGAFCIGCSVNRELKIFPLPKTIHRNPGFHRYTFFYHFWRDKRSKENKSCVSEVSLLKSAGTEDEPGQRKPSPIPWEPWPSSSPPGTIKAKTLFCESSVILPHPQQRVFPAKCYLNSLGSLVKISHVGINHRKEVRYRENHRGGSSFLLFCIELQML